MLFMGWQTGRASEHSSGLFPLPSPPTHPVPDVHKSHPRVREAEFLAFFFFFFFMSKLGIVVAHEKQLVRLQWGSVQFVRLPPPGPAPVPLPPHRCTSCINGEGINDNRRRGRIGV